MLKILKAIHKKKELAMKKQFIKLWITIKIKSEIPIKSSSYFQIILSNHTYKTWLWGFQILIFKIFEKFTEILKTIIFCLVMILYILEKYWTYTLNFHEKKRIHWKYSIKNDTQISWYSLNKTATITSLKSSSRDLLIRKRKLEILLLAQTLDKRKKKNCKTTLKTSKFLKF